LFRGRRNDAGREQEEPGEEGDALEMKQGDLAICF